MHHHPALDQSALARIGLWQSDGRLAAVVHYESDLGEAFFQFGPAFRHLRAEMLDLAEAQLAAPSAAGGRQLRVYVHEQDEAFLAMIRERGYRPDPGRNRPLFQLGVMRPFPAVSLPAGCRLTSLADECDWARVHRVLWRGFGHPGEPPVNGFSLQFINPAVGTVDILGGEYANQYTYCPADSTPQAVRGFSGCFPGSTGGGFSVQWKEGDIPYSVGGFGMSRDSALQIAEQLEALDFDAWQERLNQ